MFRSLIVISLSLDTDLCIIAVLLDTPVSKNVKSWTEFAQLQIGIVN